MFPSNPNIGSSHTEQGKVFVYNGEGWVLQSDLILPDGSRWEDGDVGQIIPKSSKHIPSTIIDGLPLFGDIVTHNVDEFATAAQGTLADTALQSVISTDNHIVVDNTDPQNPTLSFQTVDNENFVTDDEKADIGTIPNKANTSDLANYQLTSEKGDNNGYCGLDANAKISETNLPDSVLGNLKFKGTWNIVTDIITSDDVTYNGFPLPTSDATTLGIYFILENDGTFGGVDYVVGDWIVSNGVAGWKKIDNTDAVKSVNGQYGIVVLDAEDVGAAPTIHNHSGQSINPDVVVLDKTYTDAEAANLPIGSFFRNSDQGNDWLLKTDTDTYYNFGGEVTPLMKNADTTTHLNGQPVYVFTGTGKFPNVKLANSGVLSTGFIIALATQDVLHTGNARGRYCAFGSVGGVPISNVIKTGESSSLWVEGARLYLANETGKLTTVENGFYVGIITDKSGSNINIFAHPSMPLAPDLSSNSVSIAPSVKAVVDALAGKANLTGGNNFFNTQNFNGLIQQIAGQYTYYCTSLTADTINDRREYVASGIKYFQRCTVANAAKGAGTWDTDLAIDASGNIQVLKNGNYVNSLFTIGDLLNNFKIGIINVGASAYPSFWFNQTSPSATNYFFQAGSSRTYINAPSGSSNHVAINVGDAEKMMIFGSGKVVIGYTSQQPDFFAVNGSSLATTAKGGTTTDYGQLDANGLRLFGAATQYRDFIIPAANLRGGATPPAFVAFLGGLFTYSFVNGTTDILYGAFEFQHDYMEGTDVEIHVHWSPNSTNTGNVRLSFEYSVANMGAVFPAPTTMLVTDAASGQVAFHEYTTIGVISGTGRKIGDIVNFAFSRLGNDALDTFSGDMFLHSIGAHYQVDTLGSFSTTGKYV